MVTIKVSGPQGSGKSTMIGWIIKLIEDEKLTYTLCQEGSVVKKPKTDFVIIEKQGA